MANEPQKAEGGIFIDTKTGDVVHEQPEEGIQLVPAGGFVDDHAKARIIAEGGDVAQSLGVAPLETASSGDELETADDPEKTVKASTVKRG